MDDFDTQEFDTQGERGWVNGRAFLISGFVVFLMIALLAFIWTSTGATVDVPRDWWGTPTPTPRRGALPF